MKMHDIEIFLNTDDEIVISQQYSRPQDEVDVIVITKDQAELVSKWILEAAKEE